MNYWKVFKGLVLASVFIFYFTTYTIDTIPFWGIHIIQIYFKIDSVVQDTNISKRSLLMPLK